MSVPSMNMSPIVQSALSSKLDGSKVVLKPGQILTGKVLEIFPNQKASVQLGNQQFVAQLQTSLNLHSNYWFQVQSVNQLLHLKVLTDKPTKQTAESQATALLNELKLPLTKENIAFVKSLISTETPFSSNELKEALQLQQGQSDKTSQTVLTAMIKRQLPITSSIYQALMQDGKESLVNQLQQLQTILSQEKGVTKSADPLLNRIQSLQSHQQTSPVLQNTVNSYLMNQVLSGDQAVIELLKQAGIVSKELNFTAKHSILEQLVTSDKQSQTVYIDKLITLFQKQLPLDNQSKYQFNKIMESFQSSAMKGNQQLATLQTFLKQPSVASKIASVLSDVVKIQFGVWEKQPTLNNLEPMLNNLKELADMQISRNSEKKLVDILATFARGSSMLSSKEQFLIHVKQFLFSSGLDYEHQLASDKEKIMNHEPSLKQLVLQAMQHSQSGQTGRSEMESLLNTLNGLQLASVQENDAFIQASIQIPGLFGAKENIQIDFESKKEKNGQINPDYCRIVFFLELKNIGDTMIDMSVQKRVVHLTIYNDQKRIEPLLEQIKPILEQGLEKGDYNLSGVQYKQLATNTDDIKNETSIKRHKGVDFRI